MLLYIKSIDVIIGGYLQYLPLKTKITLKSPLDGQKLDPYHNPKEFLDRAVANLQTTAGWEANVQGKYIHTFCGDFFL